MEKNFKYILNEINTLNFHESTFNNIKLPDNIIDLPNIIIYGNQNIGKYYFALNLIKKYSNNNLNIQRRVEIIINKESEYFKCSDIHYEIDFYLLGTSAKNIWLTFFNHIQNILINKENKTCIILIKNFHQIHEDLLIIFYSFLQNINHINIKFVILTQHYKFIPNNIINRCVMIKLKEPNINKLKKNNKNIYFNNFIFYDNYIDNTNLWISYIVNFRENYINDKKDKGNIYKDLRDIIYDILIKNYNIHTVTTYIIFTLIEVDLIKDNNKLLQKYYEFIKLYNNNYRPIYHLEKFTFDIIDNLKN